MQMYTANILGSDAYFSRQQKELEALMDSEGMPTFWWTFSAADNHWFDLHEISGQVYDRTEKQKAKQRRKFVRDNQHIVDAYFYWRMQKILSTYFGANALDARWI